MVWSSSWSPIESVDEKTESRPSEKKNMSYPSKTIRSQNASIVPNSITQGNNAITTRNRQIWVFPGIPVIALIVAASGMHLPYAYFTLTRIIVCLFSCAIAYDAFSRNDALTKIVFVCIAILFNPILPIHLQRDDWEGIDLITAGVFVTWYILKHRRDRRSHS